MHLSQLSSPVSSVKGAKKVKHVSHIRPQDFDSTVNNVLSGTVNGKVYGSLQKIVPKNKLTVFVSSTFTDTWRERNLLHEEILPKLQTEASKDDIQVILYDMRFGVKDENTKDHLTWEICRDAIKKCYEESDGLFFLSLQSEKYGYMPLPKFIEKETMESTLGKPGLPNDLVAMAKEWYVLDENHFPPRYELKNLRTDSDVDVYWKEVLPSLRDKLLDSMNFEKLEHDSFHSGSVHVESESDFLVVNRSVTEWETVFAMHLSKGKGCRWIRRTVNPVLLKMDRHLPKFPDFCDVIDDPSKQNKLNILKGKMTSELELGGNIVNASVSIVSPSSYNQANEVMSYLSEWKESTFKLFRDEIKAVRRKKNQWIDFVVNHVGIHLHYLDEIIHHYRICYLKSSSFIERTNLISNAMQLLSQYTPSTRKNSLFKIALGVVGMSGSGKTAFMSKLATVMKNSNSLIPVIVRFCGTSRYSLHGIHLIQSICIQLLLAYNEKQELRKYLEVLEKHGYEEAVMFFQLLMSRYPVYLFIDSLDQLSNRNEARNKLSFLKGIKLDEKSRIIVSTLPDEYDEVKQKWKHIYLCERRLQQDETELIKVEKIDSNDETLVQTMISQLLKRKHRSLTVDQLSVVSSAIGYEATILYFNLAVHVISKWRSFDIDIVNNSPSRSTAKGIVGRIFKDLERQHGQNIVSESDLFLRPTVKRIVHQIFEDLESHYGKHFVSFAFSLISFSVEGINDLEMQDLLSLDEQTIKEVFQYSQVSKFPMHVWLRLKYMIKDFVTEKENLCTKWYHRQLLETASERYHPLKKKSHEVMGKYFSGKLTSGKLVVGKQPSIREQEHTLNGVPVWFPSSRVNQRRVMEAAHHLVEAGLYVDALNELCSLQSICCASLVGNIYNYILYLNQLSHHRFDHEKEQRLDHYLRWLKRIATMIPRNPRTAITALAGEEPYCSCVKHDVTNFIDSKPADSKDFRTDDWVRAKCFTGKMKFGSLAADLHGHDGDIISVSWNSDGSKIASGSSDGTIKIWDAVTGEMIDTLESVEEYVHSVSWNRDGTKITAHRGGDDTARVWDVGTGEVIDNTTDQNYGIVDDVFPPSYSRDGSKVATVSNDAIVIVYTRSRKMVSTLNGHSALVTSVSWNPDGKLIVSGSRDAALKIWEVATGQALNTIEGHCGPVYTVSWSTDGSVVASGTSDKTVKIWSATSFLLLNTLEGHRECVTSMHWNHDSSKLVTGSRDKTLKVWVDVKGGSAGVFQGHSDYVASVSWNPEGSRIASSSCDGKIKVWDSVTGVLVSTLEGHSGCVYSVSWNREGNKIASGSWDRTVKIWDVVKGLSLVTLKGRSGYVHSAVWNSNGNKVAAGLWDGTIIIWDTHSGKELNATHGHAVDVWSVSWNLDGSKLASGSGDKTVKIWNAETLELLRTFSGHHGVISSVSWSPNGSQLASGSEDGTIKLWDTGNGDIISTFESPRDAIHSVSWNDDGSKLVTGSKGKTIKIWDVSTGEMINTLEGHKGDVRCVAWNHDGSKIASGSGDKTVMVWDAMRWEPESERTVVESRSEGYLSHSLTKKNAHKGAWR
jgi:WD40 repeat protein